MQMIILTMIMPTGQMRNCLNKKYKSLANVEFGFKLEEITAFHQIAKQFVTHVDRDIIWEPTLHCKV